MLKIMKYCTGSSATSYQCKFVIDHKFKNKNIESMKELGAAIKEIIHFRTIRGKFSSVHPDLAAEGITRVEVGEEGLHFFRGQQMGQRKILKAVRRTSTLRGKFSSIHFITNTETGSIYLPLLDQLARILQKSLLDSQFFR